MKPFLSDTTMHDAHEQCDSADANPDGSDGSGDASAGPPPPIDAGRLLGIDYGTKRIGVAASDRAGIAAHVVEVVPGSDVAAAIKRIREIADEREATTIVVGLPRNMDYSEGASAEAARDFAARLVAGTDIRVALWDERWSSREAERALRHTGARGRKVKARVDGVAAQIILQSYMQAGCPPGAGPPAP